MLPFSFIYSFRSYVSRYLQTSTKVSHRVMQTLILENKFYFLQGRCPVCPLIVTIETSGTTVNNPQKIISFKIKFKFVPLAQIYFCILWRPRSVSYTNGSKMRTKYYFLVMRVNYNFEYLGYSNCKLCSGTPKITKIFQDTQYPVYECCIFWSLSLKI